jgi:hypothetical protein
VDYEKRLGTASPNKFPVEQSVFGDLNFNLFNGKCSIHQKCTLFSARKQVAHAIRLFTDEIGLLVKKGKMSPLYGDGLGSWKASRISFFPGILNETK